jgi:hypothetical protein
MGANLRLPALTVSALLIVVGACGRSDGDRLGSPLGAPNATAVTTTAPAESAAPAQEGPTTTTTTTASTLPGEPYDAIAGTVAEVAGVAVDEVFVIRALPGEDRPVAASLPPLTQLVFTGRGRQIDQGTHFERWVEVTAGDATGWIAHWSLVYLGAPRDVTAETVSAVGVWPTAPTMLELGRIVTDADPQVPPPDVVLVAELGAGPVSQVVYDVFPDEAFGDDVARGTRRWVTGRQVPAGDLPPTRFASSLAYELVSVEVRSLCTRGVDASSGFCI